MEITWRDILDSSKFSAGTNISDFIKIFVKTLYPYFCWNGKIYALYGGEYLPLIIDHKEVLVDDIPMKY